MKTIPNFPDYAITRDGCVWSKPRNSRHNNMRFLQGKWLSPRTKKGHLYVSLRNESGDYNLFVHRLVLQSYIGNCPVGQECRHLDGNPQNNNLSNLCWGTSRENKYDTVWHGRHLRVGLKGSENKQAKLTDEKVRIIRFLRRAGFMLKDLAWQFDVSVSGISHVCENRTWKHLLSKGE